MNKPSKNTPLLEYTPDMKEEIAKMPDRSQYRPGKIDPFFLRSLIADNPNLNQYQLAKLLGVTHQAVNGLVKSWDIDVVADKKYIANRADIFAAGQRLILSIHLAPERIKKWQAHQAALWYNSLYNNERLERSQSTENVNINQVSLILSKIQTSQEKLGEELDKLEE